MHACRVSFRLVCGFNMRAHHGKPSLPDLIRQKAC